MIRVGDMRTKSHLLEAHIRAVFISKRTTREGEVIKYHQQELEVGGEGEKYHRVFLFWPTVLLHQIDENSPLYNVSPEDLTEENNSFEIIVILEGINESTGLSAQARTSYLPSEIVWGHRFKDLHRFKNDSGARVVDYALFHHTYSVKTPFLSAAEMAKNGNNYEYDYNNDE
jgi:potassium inwardly-rectifying channel subfamily J